MCPVCKNEEIELGQKYCQICGEPLEWEEEASAEGLSLDEAIIHARETAEKKYLEGFLYYANSGNIENDKKNDEYIKCAEEHEQLAEWLEELKKYREVENQHRWIPVEERLPEDGTYLCTLDGELCGLDEPFTGMCGIENGKWDEEGCVIAWMPLPAPYQKEEKR